MTEILEHIKEAIRYSIVYGLPVVFVTLLVIALASMMVIAVTFAVDAIGVCK